MKALDQFENERKQKINTDPSKAVKEHANQKGFDPDDPNHLQNDTKAKYNKMTNVNQQEITNNANQIIDAENDLKTKRDQDKQFYTIEKSK
jgi:hypothetical protein